MKKAGSKSLFITFEGAEGSGKSTQARKLYQRLEKLSVQVLLIHEPGSTPLGEKLSHLLKKSNQDPISPRSELMLFNAARAQLVKTVIAPSLKKDIVVVCDRYTDSTVAYQGYGRGLELATVINANDIATVGLKPDLTVLLDMPVHEGLARKRVKHADRFESEDLAFHERVRRGYLTLARGEPDRFFVVDARQDKQRIAQVIWYRVSQLLKK